MSGLRISLLGTPTVEVDGAPLEVDTRKAVALLAYLAVAGGPRSRDEVAALLWPDYDESHGRSSLRRTLSTLRAATGGRWISAGRDRVTLEADEVWCDVHAFRTFLEQTDAHRAQHDGPCAACLGRLTDATALCRADFLAGFTLRDSPEFEDWQLLHAEQLRRELDGALDALVRAHTASGDVPAAIAAAERRLALDPLNEGAHSALMQLFALLGDRAAALRQYRECVRVLHDELGVAPLEATTERYQSIFAGDVVAPPELAGAPTAGSESARIEAASDLLATRELPFAGRAAEATTLRNAYDAIEGHGHLVVIEGEAGIGKTRLAGELIQHAAVQGGIVLTAQCYEGEQGIAYAPIAGLLRAALAQEDITARLAALPSHDLVEARRLLPELAQLAALPEAASLDTAAARARFLEGLSAVITALVAGGAPGMVLVEDLHCADEASTELLAYLARRLEGRRVCLVLTWRSEELPPAHALRRLLAERLRAGDASHSALERLDRAAVRTLIEASAVPADQVDALEGRLFEETEGLPFFVTQYLAAAADLEAPGDWAMPPTVRDLLQSRVASVVDADAQLLATAAVIGRSFRFDVLRDASGRSEEETIAALERLIGRGFLRPSTAGALDVPAYDFTHQRLRAFSYEETSPARRRLLHRRTAEVLSRDRHSRDSLAGLVAHHALLAGEDEAAAAAFEAAGNYARALHAPNEALAHYEAALAAGHPEPTRLHEAIGGLRTLTGAYGAAMASYQAAAAFARPEHLASVEHKIGALYIRLGAWALADEHLASALTGPIPATGGHRARILADRSLVAHREGRDGDATTLARQSLRLAQSSEDIQALAQSHNILGMLATSRGDDAVAALQLRLSLETADRLDDADARIAALNNLALSMHAREGIDEARALLEAALTLCIEQGDRHREAALRNNLADLLRAAGLPDESMAQLKEAVALFAEIGADREEYEPGIWKLVNW